MKQSITVGAQLLWSGRYGCNNGRYGCTIVMSYIEINKAVSQWLLTFHLCISDTWPLTCAFHIPCTHTPEIIDMHRGVCDKSFYHVRSVAPSLLHHTFHMRTHVVTMCRAPFPGQRSRSHGSFEVFVMSDPWLPTCTYLTELLHMWHAYNTWGGHCVAPHFQNERSTVKVTWIVSCFIPVHFVDSSLFD